MINILHPTDWTASRMVRINDAIRCEITVGGNGHMTVEWDPRIPNRLTRKELARYRRARHELLVQLAERRGIGVLVIEA